MIRVESAQEPADFNNKVRQPGLRALAEMIGEPNLPTRPGRRRKVIANTRDEIPPEKFPIYWTEALPELLEAFGRVCAYTSFYIEPVTGAASVDHMLPKSVSWNEAYEWKNYRLACSLMNSRKNDYRDVIDPFEIEGDWFRIELVGYQVIPADNLPKAIEKRVQDTIDRLKLNDHECLKLREEYVEAFKNNDISLNRFRRRAPFLAQEVERTSAKKEA